MASSIARFHFSRPLTGDKRQVVGCRFYLYLRTARSLDSQGTAVVRVRATTVIQLLRQVYKVQSAEIYERWQQQVVRESGKYVVAELLR